MSLYKSHEVTPAYLFWILMLTLAGFGLVWWGTNFQTAFGVLLLAIAAGHRFHQYA